MDLSQSGVALAALLHRPVRTIERIGHGGNSKVYRVECEDGSRYAAKFYFQSTMDGLDRLQVEFSSLSWLWDSGIRCIPRPVAADRGNQIAVYEFVDGERIPSEAVTPDNVRALTTFAGELKALAPKAPADMQRAAEACFSFSAVHATIAARLARLREVNGDGPSYAGLQAFLEADLTPAVESVAVHARSLLDELSWDAEIPIAARTLSPSDLGFHNALRRPDGSVVVIDFEYFGWDDPAKMICDFVLHPAMTLGDALKREYVERMVHLFGADPTLSRRLPVAYRLFGLKWCTILLNEYVPRFLARREFAGQGGPDREQIRLTQLDKSKRMLDTVMKQPAFFPPTGRS